MGSTQDVEMTYGMCKGCLEAQMRRPANVAYRMCKYYLEVFDHQSSQGVYGIGKYFLEAFDHQSGEETMPTRNMECANIFGRL